MEYDVLTRALQQQLEQAKAADPDLQVFGAKKHQYRWNPPAELEVVEKFEQKLGTTLPEAYRNFLLYGGNGGAGPFYGLFSLEEVEHWLQWELEPDRPPLLCPEKSAGEITGEENWTRGCIPIGSQGDTYFTGLMVRGEHRGRVVYAEYEGGWVFFPKEENFLLWYQRWLREVCNHYESQWFATELDGDEAQLQACYEHAQTEEDRLHAIESMKKFPVLSRSAAAFLEQVMWERRDMEDARVFLPLIYGAGPEFFQRFLDSRWQAGLYDAVILELYSAINNLKEDTQIPERWQNRILDKLGELAPNRREYAVSILQKSGAVPLDRLIWVLREEPESSVRQDLITSFARFPNAAENVEFWLELLEERDDLETLSWTLFKAPSRPDPRLKEAVSRIQEEFAFAKEELFAQDYNDEEEMARVKRRERERDVYRSACEKAKKIWYEEINPQVEGVPRPYQLDMNYSDLWNLEINQPAPPDGIPVHPMVALVLRQKLHHLPQKTFAWNMMLGQIKKLSLVLNQDTSYPTCEQKHAVNIYAPGEFPPPKPYYYSMEGWSILGRMEKLKELTISQICVEDFSFLPQCKGLEQLNLYNTNFTDCRLLLEMPALKHVELGLCRLEHVEVLDSAPFTYSLSGD